MKDYRNVECTRCGNQWYSEKFDENDELPENCSYCYRDSVREIPPPPTVFDKLSEKFAELRHKIPEKAAEKHHKIILWKENNKLLIGMATTGTIILSIITALSYILFF